MNLYGFPLPEFTDQQEKELKANIFKRQLLPYTQDSLMIKVRDQSELRKETTDKRENPQGRSLSIPGASGKV